MDYIEIFRFKFTNFCEKPIVKIPDRNSYTVVTKNIGTLFIIISICYLIESFMIGSFI